MKKLTVNGSYSNFRAHTQIKNQFDYINEVRLYDNLDTLNFTQISQNANLNLNYNMLQNKVKRQSINVNLSYQNTTEKQDAFLVDVLNNDSQFFNGNMAYNLTFSEKNLSITGAFNSTFSTISINKTTTLGPTLAIAKLFFDKKFRTAFSSSYNTTSTDGMRQGDVLNFRLNGSYRWLENHNFNVNIIQLFRNSSTQSNVNDFTATIGYNYTFNNRKKRKKIGKELKEEKQKPREAIKTKEIRIIYKGYQFYGMPEKITEQLDSLQNNINLDYLAKENQTNLKDKLTEVQFAEKSTVKDYKNRVHAYLDELKGLESNLKTYQKQVITILNDLNVDIVASHNELEKKYVESKAEFDKSSKTDVAYETKKQAYEEVKQRFIHHCYILKQLQKPKREIIRALPIHQGNMLQEVQKMRRDGIGEQQIEAQVKMALIAHYDEQASLHATEDDIVILR